MQDADDVPVHDGDLDATRFRDAWEGRCSGWSRPLSGEAAQAGWDAATAADAVTLSATDGHAAMERALSAWLRRRR